MSEHFRYLLEIDVPATDVRVLLDALEDEPMELWERLGAAEIRRQLAEFAISVDESTPERWERFDRDVEMLSTYLAAPVVGTEIRIDDTREPALLEGWRIIGRGGEVVRIALDLSLTDDGGININGASVDELAAQLPDFPRWAQSLLALPFAASVVGDTR